MNVEPNHPLAEILARKLLGIEGVPQAEQTKMVRRAIAAAVEWHESENADLRRRLAAAREGLAYALEWLDEVCNAANWDTRTDEGVAARNMITYAYMQTRFETKSKEDEHG